jgi:hypothetical protein
MEALTKASEAKKRLKGLSQTECKHELEDDTRERLLTEEEIAEEAAREWDEKFEDGDLVFDGEELPALLVPSAYEEMMDAAKKGKWKEAEAKLQMFVMKGTRKG